MSFATIRLSPTDQAKAERVRKGLRDAINARESLHHIDIEVIPSTRTSVRCYGTIPGIKETLENILHALL